MVSQLRQVWNDHRLRRQLREMLPALNRFALTLTRSKHDAEDLVQMACEQALMQLPMALPDDQMRSEMQGSMRTLWSGELRGRDLQDRHVRDEQVNPNRTSAEDGEGLADNRALLQDLEQAILRLPKGERCVLQMVCVQGFSYKKTADVAGVPIGTVMSRLARARLHLMEEIEVDRYASSGNVRALRP
jgi:RNA polymerase sigma-70 factor (ECF subfamily)